MPVKKPMQRELIPRDSRPSANDQAAAGRAQRLSKRIVGMRRKVATAVLIGLSVSLGLYAIFGHDGLVAYRHKQHQAEQLHQQILGLQQENQRMALHDQRLKNDRNTIEYQARQQMHYTRPGEVIYTLPEAPKDAAHK